MKLSNFHKTYFILYSVLFFCLVSYFQIELNKNRDIDWLKVVFYLLLPVVSLLLVKLFLFVAFKFGFLKDKKESLDIQNTNNKEFGQIFYVTSFFTPFVSLGILVLFIEALSCHSLSDLIYTLSLEMFASYLIVVLFSFFFSRFARKLDNDISSLYKIYLVLYPIILLTLSVGLFVYQNVVEYTIYDYRADRCIIFSLPLVTTLLSFIVGCAIALIKKKNKGINSKACASRVASFGKLFFIASLITTFCNSFLFLSFVDRTSFDFEYLGELFLYFFITSYILTILIAFAIKPIIYYLKTSKITLVLLSIMYAQILLAIFYFADLGLKERVFSNYYRNYYRDEHYLRSYSEDTNPVVVEKDALEYDEFVERDTATIDDISEPEPKPFYLSFLWDNPNADRQNVTNALQEVRNSYTYSVIFTNIPDLKESDKTRPIFKIVQYISNNREDIDLSNLLTTYSDLITTIIPKSVYEKNRYDFMLGLLCDSYYDLADYEEDNHMYKMKSIYEIMYNAGGDYRDKFELIKPYIGKYYKKKYDYFGTDFDNFSDYQELVWAYSFWGRRYHEGNVEKTLQLLHEVRSLYNDYAEEY